MPKLILTSGGPGRRVMTWQVSGVPALSRDYTFTPGVPVDVTEGDAAWLTDTANTRGRVFVVAPGSATTAAETTARGGQAQGSAAPAVDAAAPKEPVADVVARAGRAAGRPDNPAPDAVKD